MKLVRRSVHVPSAGEAFKLDLVGAFTNDVQLSVGTLYVKLGSRQLNLLLQGHSAQEPLRKPIANDPSMARSKPPVIGDGFDLLFVIAAAIEFGPLEAAAVRQSAVSRLIRRAGPRPSRPSPASPRSGHTGRYATGPGDRHVALGDSPPEALAETWRHQLISSCVFLRSSIRPTRGHPVETSALCARVPSPRARAPRPPPPSAASGRTPAAPSCTVPPELGDRRRPVGLEDQAAAVLVRPVPAGHRALNVVEAVRIPARLIHHLAIHVDAARAAIAPRNWRVTSSWPPREFPELLAQLAVAHVYLACSASVVPAARPRDRASQPFPRGLPATPGLDLAGPLLVLVFRSLCQQWSGSVACRSSP